VDLFPTEIITMDTKVNKIAIPALRKKYKVCQCASLVQKANTKNKNAMISKTTARVKLLFMLKRLALNLKSIFIE
jgi:hypothetical protein